MEFAPLFLFLVISPLTSLTLLDLPYPFHSFSSTRPIQTKCRPTNVVSILPVMLEVILVSDSILFQLFIIPDPEVTFSFPWAVPPHKIDPFGSWSMMSFLLILTIGFLYEWKRGASDWES